MDVKDAIKALGAMNTGLTFIMIGAKLLRDAKSDDDIDTAIECVASGLGYLSEKDKDEVKELLKPVTDAMRRDPYIGKHEKCEIWVNAIENA